MLANHLQVAFRFALPPAVASLIGGWPEEKRLQVPLAKARGDKSSHEWAFGAQKRRRYPEVAKPRESMRSNEFKKVVQPRLWRNGVPHSGPRNQADVELLKPVCGWEDHRASDGDKLCVHIGRKRSRDSDIGRNDAAIDSEVDPTQTGGEGRVQSRSCVQSINVDIRTQLAEIRGHLHPERAQDRSEDVPPIVGFGLYVSLTSPVG
jgi:hypothetical protein